MPRSTTELALLRVLTAARLPLLAALFGAFAVFAGTSAAELSLVHIDGAFQTFAMLRHIDAGRWPGRDFLPYLGIAIPSVLWPFYRLAGGTLWASQATTLFAGLAVTFAGGALLSALALRSLGLRRTAWLAVAGGGLATVLALPGPANLHSLVMPGASLYSLRSAATYAVAALVVWAARRGSWSVPVSAGGAGVLLLWSNDYAFTSVLALHIALIAHFAGRVPIARLARLAITSLCCAGLLYLVLVTVATAGSPVALWRFNFFGVAADQYWYFAPYGRSDHYFVPLDLLSYWRRQDLWLSTVLVLTPFLAIACLDGRLRRRLPVIALAAALWTAFASGMLSEIGGHKNPGYHQMTAQVLPFALLAAVGCARRGSSVHWQRLRTSTQRLFPVVELSVAALTVLCIGLMLAGSRMHLAHLNADARLRFEPTLDGFVPRGYAEELRQLRARMLPRGDGASTASAYLSPYAIVLRHRQVPPVDSVIHALGFLREPFTAALRAPSTDVAVTTNGRSSSSLDIHWAQWGVHQNWAYYGTLARLFEPTFVGSRTVLWERREKPADTARPQRCDVLAGRASVLMSVVGQRPGTAYELTIRYRLQCDGQLVHRRALVVAEVPYESPLYGGHYSVQPPRAGEIGTARLLHVPQDATRRTRLFGRPIEHCHVELVACRATTLPHVDEHLRSLFGIPNSNLTASTGQ